MWLTGFKNYVSVRMAYRYQGSRGPLAARFDRAVIGALRTRRVVGSRSKRWDVGSVLVDGA